MNIHRALHNFDWGLFAMILFALLFIGIAMQGGVEAEDRCTELGGTNYRALCFAPGTLIDTGEAE